VARRDRAETGGTERRMECLGDGAGQGAVGRPVYVVFEDGTKPPISVHRGQQGDVSTPDASLGVQEGKSMSPIIVQKKRPALTKNPKRVGRPVLSAIEDPTYWFRMR